MNEWERKLKYSDKTCPSADLVIIDPILDLPRARAPATALGSQRLIRLSYGSWLQH
jgi:hypothetical protein